MLRRAHLADNIRLDRHQRLDADVLDAAEDLQIVDAESLVLLTELLQRPLAFNLLRWCGVLVILRNLGNRRHNFWVFPSFSCLLTFFGALDISRISILILIVPNVLLVDTVIGQVHEAALQAALGERVSNGGQADESLTENICF